MVLSSIDKLVIGAACFTAAIGASITTYKIYDERQNEQAGIVRTNQIQEEIRDIRIYLVQGIEASKPDEEKKLMEKLNDYRRLKSELEQLTAAQRDIRQKVDRIDAHGNKIVATIILPFFVVGAYLFVNYGDFLLYKK